MKYRLKRDLPFYKAREVEYIEYLAGDWWIKLRGDPSQCVLDDYLAILLKSGEIDSLREYFERISAA